jgi:hypothetical protein
MRSARWAVAGGIVFALISGSALSGMVLTAAGVSEGFSLSTCAAGFASAATSGGSAGPLGIAFAGATSWSPTSLITPFRSFPVMRTIKMQPGSLRVVRLRHPPRFGHGGRRDLHGENLAGKLVQINADGTFNQTILTGLNHPTGMTADPADRHLFLSNQFSNQILNVNPIKKAAAVLIPSVTAPEGLSFSPDGKALFFASPNHILGFSIVTHSQVFQSDEILRLTPPRGGFGAPEPSGVLLFGIGLSGLADYARKHRRRQAPIDRHVKNRC